MPTDDEICSQIVLFEHACFYCRQRGAMRTRKVQLSQQLIAHYVVAARYRVRTADMPICERCDQRIRNNNAVGAALVLFGVAFWMIQYNFYRFDFVVGGGLLLVGAALVLTGCAFPFMNILAEGAAKDSYRVYTALHPEIEPDDTRRSRRS